jgi:hypothetical protein
MLTRWVIPFLILLTALMLVGAAVAAVQAYQLDWWTVDSSGGISTSGDYFLSGTIGQAEAGSMSSGDYTLSGGFWGRGAAPAPLSQRIFLPLTIK